MISLSVVLLVLALPTQPASARGPVRVVDPTSSAAFQTVARATRAVDRDSLVAVERQWVRALSANPADRAALLGLSTLARATARIERADSLAQRLVGADAASPAARTDAWVVLGRMGLARSLASGRSPARADSILLQARTDAQQLGDARLESGALLALAVLRARTRGIRAALPLIRESRQRYPKATAAEESYRSCIEGNFSAIAGDTVTARRLVDGVRLAQRTGEWRMFAECKLYQSQLLESRGYFEASLRALDDATTWLRRLHADAPLAAALQRAAYVRLQQGEFSRAMRDYAEAIDRARQVKDASVEAWALTGLGQLAVTLNDVTGATRYLDAAMTMQRARNDQWGIAAVRYLQGETFLASGNVVAARAALSDAVDAHMQSGQQLLAIAPLRQLAQLDVSQGRVDEAARSLARATAYATATGDQGWLNELPYHQAAIAIARGRYADADSLLRLVGSMPQYASRHDAFSYNLQIRSADLAMRRDDFPAAERAMMNAIAVLAAWRLEFAEKDTRLRIAEARQTWGAIGQEYPALIARLSASGRVAGAFALAEASRARELTNIALQQSALSLDPQRDVNAAAGLRKRLSAVTAVDVQRGLDDSTAMLVYVAGRGAAPTTVFVVTRRNLTAKVLAPVDSIATVLDRFLRLTEDGAAPSALARQLSDAVLRPAVVSLPAGITHLIVVPERSLYRVPFEALPLPDGRLAIEQFSVVIAPSATLAMSAAPVGTPVGGTVMAFGDADYAAKVAGNRARNIPWSDEVALMPRLRYSGDEVRRIARYARQSRVFVREQASERALRSADFRSVGVLHLATHAIVDDRSLQHNLLVLAPGSGEDGRVGPDELGSLRLQRTLVVLSGCRTVGGTVLGGEGLRGLIAPLLEAGAAAVVATHWPIGDASIVPMVDRLYRHLARGATVATALRDAKRDALRDGVPATVWAAFVVVGDGTLRVPLRPISDPPLPWTQWSGR